MHGDIFKEGSRLDLHIVAFMWARHAMKSPICKVPEEDDMDMGDDWIAGCHVNVFAEKKKTENFSHNTQKLFMSPLMQRDQPLTSWHVGFRSSFLLFSPVDFWRIWSFQNLRRKAAHYWLVQLISPAPIGMQYLILCVEDSESLVTLWSYVE